MYACFCIGGWASVYACMFLYTYSMCSVCCFRVKDCRCECVHTQFMSFLCFPAFVHHRKQDQIVIHYGRTDVLDTKTTNLKANETKKC